MYKDIVDIAKEVRAKLRHELPGYKFSVRIARFAGGRELTVALMAAPESPFATPPEGEADRHDGKYTQLNRFHIKQVEGDLWMSNGVYLTEKAAKVLKRAVEIGMEQNWGRSEPMSDYTSVNYFFHLEIGRWNKPFTLSRRE